ncbi:MAG: glycosyltransferase [Candidatus Accumulibacter sp.]|jgi:spore maturation protein CgeB|nr:glycosyltransferase [Accumulibacter sp.]
MTSETAPRRFLVLDGIGGVPLGREIAECLRAEGHVAAHFDCLGPAPRPLYGARSSCAKVVGRLSGMEFNCLPRLRLKELYSVFTTTMPTHILVIGFIYKFFDLAELRRLADEHQATLVLYDTDSCNLFARRREFVYFIERELPIYDRVFSFSRVTTEFFVRTRGLDAQTLPFAANPIVLPDTPEKDIDALFVGSGDLRRIFLLEAIRERVTIFGNRWQRHRPLISRALWARITDRPVWGEELHRLLARAKIVLNITRSDFHGAETGVNLRVFEAVAAGAFLLTDHCDEIGELFRVGEEIETCRSSRELADKTRFYLKNDAKREAIARRGHARFLENHTWRARIRQMLAHLEQMPDNSDRTP